MTRAIFKYPLPPMAHEEIRVIHMPQGAVARHVADQTGTICVWAEVDPAAPVVPYEVIKEPTGGVIPDGFEHAGTVLESYGIYVWHYYIRARHPQ